MKDNKITRYGIMTALIVVGLALDSVITATAPLKIAVASLLIVLPLCQMFTFKESLFASTTFGVLSMLRAYLLPSITSPSFMNPLVSVLPRVVIGVTAYFTYKALRRAMPDTGKKKYIPYAVSAGVGVLTNTVLVITMINVVGNGNVIDALIKTLLGVNCVLEFCICVICVPFISYNVGKVVNKKKNTANEVNK